MKILTKIVTTIREPNIPLPKKVNKILTEIHDTKILTWIVSRIPALKIFTKLLTKIHETKFPVLRLLRKL